MIDKSIVRVHQHCAAKKQQDHEAMRESRGGLSTSLSYFQKKQVRLTI
ncbi:MAG: hypothetical protein H6936_10475 [Burkholderiales bacterium]|nr:hypothetical protein [Burkholderiales bacterium]